MISYSNSALIVIDLQPIFIERVPNIELDQFKENVISTLTYFRTLLPSSRIVHLRANYADSPMKTRSRMLNPGLPIPTNILPVDWGAENPLEPVFTKDTINGFHNTLLAAYLQSEGVETIYLIGLLTAACVHETAIGGLNRGFIPVLIEDACVDKTPLRHQQVIDLYNDYLYQVLTLKELRALS
jgi:nicotinamidase-related amidase